MRVVTYIAIWLMLLLILIMIPIVTSISPPKMVKTLNVIYPSNNSHIIRYRNCFSAADNDQAICRQTCSSQRNHTNEVYQLYVTNVAMKAITNVSTSNSLLLRVQPMLTTDQRKQQLSHQHRTGAVLACIQSLTAVSAEEDYTICTQLNLEHDSLDNGVTLAYHLPSVSNISNSSIHLLHLWVTAADQDVGRILTSAVCCHETDLYLAIDLSLPGGGFDLHREAVGRRLHTDVCVIAASPFPLPDARGCAIMNNNNVVVASSSSSSSSSSSLSPPNNDTKEQVPCPCVLCGRAFESETYPSGDPILLANQEVCASRTPQTVNEPLTHPHSLQRVTADFCAQHRLTHVACGYLAAHLSSVVYKDILASMLGLPAVQHMPTPQDPFVFLHIEKTAGSALRTFAGKSADRLGLGSFLPCYGGLDCFTFNVINSTFALGKADLSDIAIVGGHFSWNIWQELPSYQTAHGYNTNALGKEGGVSKVADSCTVVSTDHLTESEPSNLSCQPKETPVNHVSHSSSNTNMNLSTNPGPSPNSGLHSNPSPGLPEVPACFIAMRHPVARAISFYYQRCYETYGCEGYHRYMNDLSVDELSSLLENYRYVGTNVSTKEAMILDDGMNDASCRALQSIEPTMRGMPLTIREHSSGKMDVEVPIPPPPLSPKSIQTALKNVEHCVIGITEFWSETSEPFFRRWFPWLLFEEYTILRTEMLYSPTTGAKAEYLRDELKQVILDHNPCDLALYEKMVQLHEKQMDVVFASAYVGTSAHHPSSRPS